MLFSNVWNSIPTKRLNLSKIVPIMQKTFTYKPPTQTTFLTSSADIAPLNSPFHAQPTYRKNIQKNNISLFRKKTFAFSLQNK